MGSDGMHRINGSHGTITVCCMGVGAVRDEMLPRHILRIGPVRLSYARLHILPADIAPLPGLVQVLQCAVFGL